ncbi:MAG: N-acetyltransferase family protein [Betaproteobacteria bacterium]|nr:N-acetyltransferase family protein [Betaproteobacteria bacterium]NDH58080.1 N-acetyltransferase family protein [Betaproteobacteria bacterium]
MHTIIRPAVREDLARITAIYSHHVLHGSASFELEAPTLEDMTERWDAVLRQGFPYLVICSDQGPLGYAYANHFRTRPAYRFSLENSIYMDAAMRGKGLGSALLQRLMADCEDLGARQMIAVIGDSANVASIALHARCGFRFAGVLRASGWKHGRWLDTVLMQASLGAGDLSPGCALG